MRRFWRSGKRRSPKAKCLDEPEPVCEMIVEAPPEPPAPSPNDRTGSAHAAVRQHRIREHGFRRRERTFPAHPASFIIIFPLTFPPLACLNNGGAAPALIPSGGMRLFFVQVKTSPAPHARTPFSPSNLRAPTRDFPLFPKTSHFSKRFLSACTCVHLRLLHRTILPSLPSFPRPTTNRYPPLHERKFSAQFLPNDK